MTLLHFSIPDKGPLTDFESWMPDFMKGLAKGIENSRGLIQKAMEDVSGDMTVSPTFSLAGTTAGMIYPGNTDTSILNPILEAISNIRNGEGGDTIIPVYIGQDRIDEIVVTAAQRANYRSGGR